MDRFLSISKRVKLKGIIYIISLFIFNFNIYGQGYVIHGTISQLPVKKIYLTTLFGHQQEYVDSVVVDRKGNFIFKMGNKTEIGLYRIMCGKDMKTEYQGGEEIYIDLIFNNEDIVFSTNFNSMIDSMTIYVSKENKIFYDFLKIDEKTNMQSDVLNQLTSVFPRNDDFYPTLEKQYNKIQKKYYQDLNKMIKANPGTFAVKLIKAQTGPPMPYNLMYVVKTEFLKRHYFDNIDFKDTLLLKTDIFSTKALGYVKLYLNSKMRKETMDEEMMKAVDTVLTKARANKQVFDYLLEYLISGFEKLDNEKVLIHISDNFTGDKVCENNDQMTRLNKRVEGFKKLAIGLIAPDIDIPDTGGKLIKWSDIHSEYILLIFWASWCPHCVQSLPELKQYYDGVKRNKLEVVAVSLDTNVIKWKNFINKNHYNWINVSELSGWQSKIAQDYYVYATPTLYLLDKGRKIIAKPKSLKEIKSFLKL